MEAPVIPLPMMTMSAQEGRLGVVRWLARKGSGGLASSLSWGWDGEGLRGCARVRPFCRCGGDEMDGGCRCGGLMKRGCQGKGVRPPSHACEFERSLLCN